MRYILILLLALHSISFFGQKKSPIDNDRLKMYEEIIYYNSSYLFKKEKYYSKLDKKYKFPWKKYTLKQLKEALDTISKTSKIKTSRFLGLGIELSSYLPNYLKDEDEIRNILKINIKKNDLIYLDGTNTKIIKENSRISFGSHNKSEVKNGISYNYKWKTLSTKFKILDPKKNEEKLKGNILFKISLIAYYDYLKISKSDIGKSFQLGNYKFKIINFIDNKAILDFKDNITTPKLSFINIDDKGYKISQLSNEVIKMLKQKENIPSDAKSLSDRIQEVPKNIYELFKSSPSLSLEEYREKMRKKFIRILQSKDQKKMAKKLLGKKYTILRASDKIQNILLYLPKNTINKEFEVELKK